MNMNNTEWTDATGVLHTIPRAQLDKALAAIYALANVLHENPELQEYVKRPPYKDPLCVKSWQGGMKRLASQIVE